MCMTDGSMPGSVAEALRMAGASMDYLNSPAAADLPAAACGQALAALGEIQAKVTAAHAALLRRFDALDGHDADGVRHVSVMAGRDGQDDRQGRQGRRRPDATAEPPPAPARRAGPRRGLRVLGG